MTRALSNDIVLFEVIGYRISLIRLLVFGLSDIFLTIAGCLTVYETGLDPHIGMLVLINSIVAMIIGGSGNFNACIVGGMLLGLIQAIVIYQFSANWQYAISFVILLIFLLFRPQGIMGYKKRLV
ncbi:MAG: hypothetical protein LUE98_18950 [Tannerellaceae bacterium]|nr:hypothetical protein [Tannerellaceae bacterium]